MKAILYNSFDNISLPQWTNCQLLDVVSVSWNKNISLEDNVQLSYFLFVHWASCSFDITILWSDASLNLYVLSYSSKHIPITVRVHTKVDGHKITLHQYFLNFVGKEGYVDLDTNILVSSSASFVEWLLSQEYVLLWKDLSVSTLPWLSICSKDVSVQHSCKIHTFDEDSLFYLATKWLDSITSKYLLLDWYFSLLSSHFDHSFSEYFLAMKEKILRFIF